MKVALYTAIYGAYDKVKPVPLDLGAPAFLFTDSVITAEHATEAGWFARVVPHSVTTLHGAPEIVEPMLNHKWWKTHPELACPGVEVSLWVDGSMEVAPGYVEKCLGALGEDDWACVRHPDRACIYPEADLSAALTWRYDAPSIKAQAAHYSQFHPEKWGLIATGANARRHTPEVLELSELWWVECLNWSHQDQLSLPVLLRLAEEKVRWNYNIPWHDVEWWRLFEHAQ